MVEMQAAVVGILAVVVLLPTTNGQIGKSCKDVYLSQKTDLSIHVFRCPVIDCLFVCLFVC